MSQLKVQTLDGTKYLDITDGVLTLTDATGTTTLTPSGTFVLSDGSDTLTLDPGTGIKTTAGVGAVNGATVTAVEYGDGAIWHKTVLTLTANVSTYGDEAGVGQYGGTKIYDFPEGLITILSVVVDGSLTLAAPAIDTWAGDVGVGTAAPTQHAAGVNGAGVAILDTTAIGAATSKVAVTDAVSAATALTESAARTLDGTSTAVDLFLNFLVDDNAAHDNTITGAWTGVVTVVWCNGGDKA